MSRHPIDASLIEACRNGDAAARHQLFVLNKDFVYSMARCYFPGDDIAARDITQDIFVKLFTTIGQFRGESGFRTWLYRMVIHACIDETRKRKRWATPGGATVDEVLEATTAGEAHPFESRPELRRAVKQGVSGLSPKLREVLLLKYFEDLSYSQIGAVLGLSPGTVASRLNRGHRELARRLRHLREKL